ncbi:MAG TPA: hypothetical protein VNE86_04470, partial [Nitrososphaerales archaeon]|nr:hypothetical protein [Nitrososphaerales archaeon]
AVLISATLGKAILASNRLQVRNQTAAATMIAGRKIISAPITNTIIRIPIISTINPPSMSKIPR